MKLTLEFEDRIDTDDFISDFDEILYDIKRRLSEVYRQTYDHNFRI